MIVDFLHNKEQLAISTPPLDTIAYTYAGLLIPGTNLSRRGATAPLATFYSCVCAVDWKKRKCARRGRQTRRWHRPSLQMFENSTTLCGQSRGVGGSRHQWGDSNLITPTGRVFISAVPPRPRYKSHFSSLIAGWQGFGLLISPSKESATCLMLTRAVLRPLPSVSLPALFMRWGPDQDGAVTPYTARSSTTTAPRTRPIIRCSRHISSRLFGYDLPALGMWRRRRSSI
ncbi:hypothetical protein F4677DRAFT_417202 [Hypoxylon crocopeplum]|nr:hypothetical protein F4677DRAFT_417202 [Hypoxylon crocopeplum]